MDDSEKEFRIHVRVDPGGEGEGEGEGASGHPAAGVEPPAARTGLDATGPGDAEPSDEDPVIISTDDDTPPPEPSAEPTVGRARYLELGRENLKLSEQIKKLQAELYQANARSTGADSKATEHREALARAQAEFQNFRRRMDREREEAARYANHDLLRDLLPVLDNFERAMKTTPAGAPGGEDFQKGIALIYKQFQDVLANYELRSMDVLGLAFDPNVHEAVTRSAHDSIPADQVVAEHQKGYYYKDRLLRPALVGVSAGTQDEDGGPREFPQDEDQRETEGEERS